MAARPRISSPPSAASSPRSGPFPPKMPRTTCARFEAYVRETIEPAMRAIAPETGVDIVFRAAVRGLAPEPDGQAERLVRRLTGDNGTRVVSYGTEAGIFQNAGWSSVVCGPGDIAQAHQADEYIEIAELAAGERSWTAWSRIWRIEHHLQRFAAGPALEFTSSLHGEGGTAPSKAIPEYRPRTVMRRVTRRPPARRVEQTCFARH